jgi:hypothetical protein
MRAADANDNRGNAIFLQLPGRHLKVKNPIRTSSSTAHLRTANFHCNFPKRSFI